MGSGSELEDEVSTAYRIEVYWSAEDGAWIADVPDLPYCTAHGPTPHEAVAEVEGPAQAVGRDLPARMAVPYRSRPPTSRRPEQVGLHGAGRAPVAAPGEGVAGAVELGR